MRQLILDLLPEIPQSLDNFIVGYNAETLSALAGWLLPENKETSFFLWGNTGTGKTHLLKACEAFYCAGTENPDLANINDDLFSYAVDNVTALSTQGQIALFNLFNHLHMNGGKLLVADQAPPQQLALREDLRTRLGSGLIYHLNLLSDQDKKKALVAQAKSRNMPLSGEMIDYLLARAPRNMRSLMALLVALDQYAMERKRTITFPLLREILHTPLNF